MTLQLSWGEPLDAGLLAQVSASVYEELNRAVPVDKEQSAEELIEDLIEIRRELRAGKRWQQADMVRDKLDELGIALEDTSQGTVWRRRR